MAIILANDGMDKAAAKKLEDMGHTVDLNHYDGADLEKKIQEVDCIIIRSATKLRTPLIDKALETKKCKLFIRAGVGIDNIDHAYAKEKGITVMNTPNSSSDAVAELALAHMFTLARHVHKANVTMRNDEWNKKEYKGTEINGKTLGLIGFGRISQSLARKAKALGMDVLYYDLSGENKSVKDCKYASKEDVLKNSDYVSLHIPFIKEQGASISTNEFKLMKNSSYLIQTARGGVVDEKALIQALNNGEIAGAGLDVFEVEPTKNKELYSHPLVSVTPHVGASTSEAQSRIGNETIEVIKKYL